MSAAGPARYVGSNRHCKAPACGNDDPARLVPFGLAEHDIRDDAVSEQHERHRTNHFANEQVHVLRLALSGWDTDGTLCGGANADAMSDRIYTLTDVTSRL